MSLLGCGESKVNSEPKWCGGLQRRFSTFATVSFIKHNNENKVHDKLMETNITLVRLMKEKFTVAEITSGWVNAWVGGTPVSVRVKNVRGRHPHN
jgi:hypothetical protein